MKGFSADINNIETYRKVKAKMEVAEMLAIEKGMSSDVPDEFIKAAAALEQFKSRDDSGDRKYDFVEPQRFQEMFGYKEKPIMLSYMLLRNMAKTPVINAIIKTRKNQVANFTTPQNDVYSTGFVIKRRRKPGESADKKMSLSEEKEAYAIQEFILNCGVNGGWESTDFETFIRLCVDDSLTFDQYCFETVFNRKGEPHSFHAVDAATIRISDSIDPETYEEMLSRGDVSPKKKINGYYPSFSQILDNRIIAEFYPWELCFGVRNPSTDLNRNGYGIAELEEMVTIITSLLWGHEYNRNVFKTGSIPKGFLKVAGNINPSRLAEFKQMWYATMRGVQNAWRTPVLPADTAEWVDLQKNSRDMEYHQWIEFNIKLASAIYSIDPAEFNFPMAGEAGGGNSMFESSNEYKLKNSKDKGLYPLLRHIQKNINKNIVRLINPDYEFQFTGMDALTPKEEQELIDKQVRTYVTVDEIRARKKLPPLPNGVGALPLDGNLTQMKMMAEQGANELQAEADSYGYGDVDEDETNKAFDFTKYINEYNDGDRQTE